MPDSAVVCLGEAMVELSLNDDRPDTAAIAFAGDTLNTAIYLKRSAPELAVAYATKVGTDRFSDRMVRMIASECVSTELIVRAPGGLPGLYAILTDELGERSFEYWRSASAAREMFRPPGLSLETLARYEFLYFSAISLAILPEQDRSLLIEWLPKYRNHGGCVVFDSNYRPALWESAETARREISRVWRQTDIGLPSVDDEMALFGGDEGDVLKRITGFGVASGALKRGALGPIALSGAQAGPFPKAPKVVDSTAAGDSFNAGYIAARLTGQTEADCLLAGHRLAVRVVGHRGAIIPRQEMAFS